MASRQLREALAAMADIYGRQLSKAAVDMLLSDLASYPEAAVFTALNRCRKELRTFPSVADIISRVDDSRPGAEEAWAMIPTDENSSVVWSEEMSEAYGIARGLLERGEEMAARMAFKEAYTRLVSEARSSQKKARWSVSLGHDKSTHEPVLREAVAKGRIAEAQANALLAGPAPGNLRLLRGPEPEPELSQMDLEAMIAEIKKRITNP
jgi:hypothetical protein